MDATEYADYLIEVQKRFEAGESSIPVQASEIALLRGLFRAELKLKEKK